MRRYSEAVKADVCRWMGPPHRHSVAEISKELGIHVITLFKWRKASRLQGEVARWRQVDQDAVDSGRLVIEQRRDQTNALLQVCSRLSPAPLPK